MSGIDTPMAAEPALVRAIRRRAAAHPDRPAVVGTRILTFADLTAAVDAEAARLRAAGIEAGELVVIEADRSLEVIVAVVALWSIGAAYVPVDAATPEPFRRAQRQQVGARHAIVPSSADGGGGWGITSEPEAGAVSLPDPPVAGDLPAYGMSTSGTSGSRRCVIVGHRQLEALARSLRQRIYADMPAGLRVAMNGPLAFDTSVKQLVQLVDGHTLVLVPDDVRHDGAALTRHLADHRVDVIDATPSTARRWLDDGVLDEPSTLRALLLGGEAVDAALWQRLAAQRHLRCLNLYGPTECTVDVTVADVKGATPHIGTALPHAEVSIVDDIGEPVPDFVIGELVVQGEAVAWGYLAGDAGGFADTGPDRCYRTGDRARRRGDGSIEFIGRNDQQWKVRGVRLDLTEVDAALRHVAGVADAASAIRADGVMVAAIELAPDHPSPATTDIRQDLVRRVPLAYIPAELVVVDRIPTTERGKVDRQTVAGLATHLGGEPQGAAEVAIAAIMGEILGSPPFERDESFFRRGADSFALLELAARLADELGREVDVAALAVGATPAAIAEVLAEIGDPPAPGPGLVAEGSKNLRMVAHPLGDAIASGTRPPLDGAAIVCAPEIARSALGPGEMLRRLVDAPVLVAVRETAHGRLGIVMIPCYPSEAIAVGPQLLGAATRLAATYGARSVALTAELGLLPVDDGATVGLDGSPAVTSGQVSTVAAMASTWAFACRSRRRPTAGERLCVLGPGTLQDAFAEYLATLDDQPAEIVRCTGVRPPGDGFTSVVASGLPATAARPVWLDPGTIVVEYGIGWAESPEAPPSDAPPLVVSGGVLRSVAPIVDTVYSADLLHRLDPGLARVALVVGQGSIGACNLAALLVAGGHAPAVRGRPRPHDVATYREAQRALGYLPPLDAA